MTEGRITSTGFCVNVPWVWNAVRLSIVASGIALASAAFAQPPQFLVGARAGLAAPHELEFDLGPMIGVDGAYGMHRLIALEVAVEQSFHPVRRPAGTVRGRATVANVGIQYRINITPGAVPYAVLAVESRWMKVSGERTRNFAGGAFALGILSPLGRSWFAGLEARFGITSQGGFPLRQAYLAKLGYRTAAF
jgi:hypothetical protein